MKRLCAVLLVLLCSVGPSVRAEPPLDLSEYAGQIVYVDFWASWCKPCRASFPWMNRMLDEHGDKGLVILGVNSGDRPEDSKRFLAQFPANFIIVEDFDGAIAGAAGIRGMPSALLYDARGALISRHVGFNKDKAQALEEAIVKALAGLNE